MTEGKVRKSRGFGWSAHRRLIPVYRLLDKDGDRGQGLSNWDSQRLWNRTRLGWAKGNLKVRWEKYSAEGRIKVQFTSCEILNKLCKLQDPVFLSANGSNRITGTGR